MSGIYFLTGFSQTIFYAIDEELGYVKNSLNP